MLIRLTDASVPPASEITPRHVWQHRRELVAAAGGALLGAALPASAATEARVPGAIMQIGRAHV